MSAQGRSGVVFWHVTMSLDGFIAGGDGSVAPLLEYVEVDGRNRGTFDGVIAAIGAAVTGRRSYDVAVRDDQPLFGGAWQGPQFVLTHRPPAEGPAFPGVRFVAGDLADVVATARDAAAGRDVVVIGAQVAAACIAAGLLDELLVHLAPVLLGGGVRLVDALPGGPVPLDRVQVTDDDPLTTMRYRIVR